MAGLYGCGKEDSQQIAPAARSAREAAQAISWDEFKADVAAGKRLDDFGQYVSKTTWVASDGSPRPVRPKREPLRKASPSGATVGAKYVQPEEPCDGCGGGGGVYVVPYTFVSSENQGASVANPNGYILDMKLVTDNWSSWQFPGYIRLNSDLNKGAGGEYIYFTFTRDASAARYSEAYPLTLISILARNLGRPNVPAGHGQLWYGRNTGDDVPSVQELDLNDGAGGDYIYSYISAYSGYGAPIREVGVLSSRNASQQPPAGWEKVGVDLNKGAGGDYIYVCVKR
ncbi:hypothetical protein LGH70_03920 [Hymenobacter sp. BT635]|uniref:MABP domain-containing protein n=1 Tax=Hymenobacter nitidus TaxID=2880929 RepID=A0ABS8A8T9_9BACT|nr:hypothetical protein [Hymenobacter nitidus]MCB2376711.1 hypothetical protein [Hymenobacter nitidus]